MSTAESLVFLPTPRDVVVIESVNSLGGAYFTSAFLQHPKTGAGILVDERGELVEIGQEKWSEFLELVADAKEVTKDSGGGSWSRPQYESCPTDVFYDLGPADNRKEFLMFQLTGHEVDDQEPDEILRWLKGEQTIVQEIPPALVKVRVHNTMRALFHEAAFTPELLQSSKYVF
ncbi:hypothetical protein MVEN_01995800 [Mycena venus]|uniref:Uncharacterized protein n=1 Tax=Mycena venus TaxID=2733690 RepID=A0A8H6XEY9_9AGAR|nr:hypothetical protein MVEN_01995800 [Mycena venus]